MDPLSALERRDFWEICEDRYQVVRPSSPRHSPFAPASLRSDGVRDHPRMPFGIPLELNVQLRQSPDVFEVAVTVPLERAK